MCLILVGWHAHPDYPLVVAANRDEFYARPTAPAAFWADHPELLAGRDLEAGGTWFGVTRNGRLAALTNYRDSKAQRSGAPSRGGLVVNFLASSKTPEEFLAALDRTSADYNGFNLLLGDASNLHCYSNVTRTSHCLAPGIYGLSNHFLDTPWPKVIIGKSALASAMRTLPEETQMFSLLDNDAVHSDQDLPDTGVGTDWERLLSAAFVRSTDYGTRSSTLLSSDRRGRTLFTERTWRRGAHVESEVRFSFRATGAA